MAAMLVAVTLLLASYAAPTMAEIRLGMFEDMRKLSNYQDEWVIESPIKGEAPDVKFVRIIDGKRNRMEIILEGSTLFEQGHDGQNDWLIDVSRRVYAADAGPNKAFTDRGILKGLEEEEGTMMLTVDGPYDVRIASNPELKVISETSVELDKAPVRLIRAEATRESGKMNVEMWFEPKRWVLLKARVSGGRKGEEVDMTLRRLKYKEGEPLPANAFSLPTSKVDGYTKRPLSDFGFGDLFASI